MIYQRKLRQKVRRNNTSEINQALRRCFFSVFSDNLARGISTIFRLSIMHVSAAAGFNEFHFKFKEQNSEIPLK